MRYDFDAYPALLDCRDLGMDQEALERIEKAANALRKMKKARFTSSS